MAKLTPKMLLKRKTEIANRIAKLEKEITMLEREHREIINTLNLNKGGEDGKTQES